MGFSRRFFIKSLSGAAVISLLPGIDAPLAALSVDPDPEPELEPHTVHFTVHGILAGDRVYIATEDGPLYNERQNKSGALELDLPLPEGRDIVTRVRQVGYKPVEVGLTVRHPETSLALYREVDR